MQWPKLRILASRVMLDGIDRVATRLLWQDQTKLLRGSEVLYQYETSAISPQYTCTFFTIFVTRQI